MLHALKTPVPGDARPVVCDAHRLCVVLTNGEAWKLDINGLPKWRLLTKENDMRTKDKAPALIAGGASGKHYWLCDRERRLSLWSPAGMSPFAHAPLPGTAMPLVVDVQGKSALFDDGSRFMWTGGQWVPMPGVMDTTGGMRVRITRGCPLGPPRGDVFPGDVLEMPEGGARRLMAAGKAEPATVEIAG